jgi:HK97 family phage portal protein
MWYDWMNRLVNRRTARTVVTGAGVDQDATLKAIFGPRGETASGVEVTEETCLTLSAVYAAVRLLSWTPAQLPLRVYERLDNGDKELRPEHPVDRLLNVEPNPEMPAMLFRETGQVMVLQWGRSVSYVERNGAGQPIGLWPMNTADVRIDRRPDGRRLYDISKVEGKGDWPKPPTSSTVLFPHEVVDVPNLNGQSVIANAREQMGEAIAAQQFGGGFFAGGSLFAFAFKTPGRVGNPEKLREGLMDVHGTARRQIPVLEGGADLVKFGMPLTDAQFIESREFHIPEIARWYGIPPHKLRDLSRATFSNIAEQKLEWHEDLLPWLIRWEQELNRKLFTPSEQGRYFVEHVVEGLLKGDTKSRYEAYVHAVNNGLMNRNEVRRRENLPDMGPIGDIFTVQGAMINLESILEPVEESAETPPVPPTDEPEEEQEERTLLREGTRTALLDALKKAVKRETAELRVLADEPDDFLDRLEKFYKRWPEKMAATIRPCQRLAEVAGVGLDSRALADEHCRTSHAALLELSGTAKPAELRKRVSAEVAEWYETIPAILAATVFEGGSDHGH